MVIVSYSAWLQLASLLKSVFGMSCTTPKLLLPLALPLHNHDSTTTATTTTTATAAATTTATTTTTATKIKTMMTSGYPWLSTVRDVGHLGDLGPALVNIPDLPLVQTPFHVNDVAVADLAGLLG